MDIHYRPPETLRQMLRDDFFARVVVGPFGSGKSSACVIEILRRSIEQRAGVDGIRRSRWAVIRNTYRELRDTTRRTFEQWIPAQAGAWQESEFTFRIRLDIGDGTHVESDVLFRSLDRPEDVKKLLSLELTGAYINELRELPKAIWDGLTGRLGRYPSKAQGGPSWFGLWADSNPWHSGHWAARLFKTEPSGYRLRRQPSGRSPLAENIENLPAGYYERMCHGKDAEWIRVYVDGEDATADEGSVFGALLSKLEQRGGAAEFEHPLDGVFTTWDLGVSDATSIWFWRLSRDGVDLVDHYEEHGLSIDAHMDAVEARGYEYLQHWLPHDARARTLQTGMSTVQLMAQRWGPEKLAIVPSLSLADGLVAARWLLEQPGTRFHPRAAQGLEALREYRYEWDAETRTFSRTPLHDWTSHSADGFRYVAIVHKAQRRNEESRPPPAPPRPQGLNLDQLWSTARPARRRI